MHTTRFTARFGVVCQSDIIRPDVKLPFAQAQNTAQHTTRVDANSHAQFHIRRFHESAATNISINLHFIFEETANNLNLRNGIDHVQAHFNGATCMICSRFGQTRHTIITVSKNFYSKTMMILRAVRKIVELKSQPCHTPQIYSLTLDS